jgi:hypothetical protein
MNAAGKLVVSVVILILSPPISAHDDRPSRPAGWHDAGFREPYEVGTSRDIKFAGQASGYVRLKGDVPTDDIFGTLMQSVNAQGYRGKRVRFSAMVKTQDVTDWAGLWMRVDGTRRATAFDNMQDRPIKGTTDWARHEVILDVADDSLQISFGVLSAGKGQAWIDDAILEVVPNDRKTTQPIGRDENKSPAATTEQLARLRELAESLPRRIVNGDFEMSQVELDLAMMQGAWEDTNPGAIGAEIHRATKVIDGTREIITYYDKDGGILSKHQVDFQLEPSHRVSLFTYRNMKILEGEQKGSTFPGAVSYIYTISGNRFGEVNGALDGSPGPPAVRIWARTEKP